MAQSILPSVRGMKRPLRIPEWRNILQLHLPQLLGSVSPDFLFLEALRVRGLTSDETELIFKEVTWSAKVSRLCFFLGLRPELHKALIEGLRRNHLPQVAEAIEKDLQPFEEQDMKELQESFEVRSVNEFRIVLMELAPFMEPLIEWARPQLVALRCLTQEEALECQRSPNPKEIFIRSLLRRTLPEYQNFVTFLRQSNYYGLLQHLRNACLKLVRHPSYTRRRSWNLPLQALHYTKRAELSAALADALGQMTPGKRCWVLLSGIAASGKTSAALEAAYMALEEELYNFDYVIWLKAHDTNEQDVMGRAMAAMTSNVNGSGTASVHDASILEQQLMNVVYERQQKEKLLLILDDVWEDTLPIRFSSFLHVIMTSRNRKILERTNVQCNSISVPEGLTPEESSNVVRNILNEERFAVLSSQRDVYEDLNEVLDCLERLPLAVNVIAAQMKQQFEKGLGHHLRPFIATISQEVSRNSNRLRSNAEELLREARAEGEYKYVKVYAALFSSISRLEGNERDAYEIFMALPQGRLFSREMPALVWNVSEIEADNRLERFCNLNLLQSLHTDRQSGRSWFRLHKLFYNTLFINYDNHTRTEQHRRLVMAYVNAGLDSVPAEDLYFYRYFADHCRYAEKLTFFETALQHLNYLRTRLTVPPDTPGVSPLELLQKDIELLPSTHHERRENAVTLLHRKLILLRQHAVVTDLETSFLQQCLFLSEQHALYRQVRQVRDRYLWERLNTFSLPEESSAACCFWVPKFEDWLLLTVINDQWCLSLAREDKCIWTGQARCPELSKMLTAGSFQTAAIAVPLSNIIDEFFVSDNLWFRHKLPNGQVTSLGYEGSDLLVGLSDGTVLLRVDAEWTQKISFSHPEPVLGVLSVNNSRCCVAYSRKGSIAVCGFDPWHLPQQEKLSIKTAVLSSDQRDLIVLSTVSLSPHRSSCRIFRLSDRRLMLTSKHLYMNALDLVPNPHAPCQLCIVTQNGLTVFSYSRSDEHYEEETSRQRRYPNFNVLNVVWCARGNVILWTADHRSAPNDRTYSCCFCFNVQTNQTSLLSLLQRQHIQTIHHEGLRYLLVCLQNKISVFQLQNEDSNEEENGNDNFDFPDDF